MQSQDSLETWYDHSSFVASILGNYVKGGRPFRINDYGWGLKKYGAANEFASLSAPISSGKG